MGSNCQLSVLTSLMLIAASFKKTVKATELLFLVEGAIRYWTVWEGWLKNHNLNKELLSSRNCIPSVRGLIEGLCEECHEFVKSANRTAHAVNWQNSS